MNAAPSKPFTIDRDQALAQIQQRALWLAVQMVYHANKVRTVEGVKVGGHMASSASTVAPQLQSGALRLIAVAAQRRMASHPAVPTWREQGYDIVVTNWRGFMGPKSMTPAQIAEAQRLAREWKPKTSQ